MPYGVLKVDTITFTDGGVDKSVAISGLVQNPTFSGNITATGTISGNIIQGGTTVSGLTVTGTTANFASGVFTTQISGSIVKVPAGTAGTPSLQVGTGTSVAPGLYGAGTDQIGISTGGSSVVVLDSVGQLRVVNAGTAAAPAVIVGNDLNTGLYSPGADQVAISTGGTGQVFVAANGNVGLRINPSCTIDAYQSGTSQAILRLADADSRTVELRTANAAGLQAGVGTVTNQDFVAFTGNTERLRITYDGNVGIGTSSPSELLHINNASGAARIRVQASGTNNAVLQLSQTTGLAQFGTNATNVYITDSAARDFTVDTNNTERFRITSTGNVGIGTSSPNTLLHVFGGGLKVQASAINLDAISEITISNVYRTGRILSSYTNPSSTAETYIAFHTNRTGQANDTVGEAMRIAGGNVGIGTSSPSSILHCVGSKDATNFTIDAPLSTVGGSAFGNYSEVLLRNTSGSNSNAAIRAYGNVWDAAGSALGFLTSNNSAPVERLHITADGKVGIGTTNPGGLGGQKLTVSDGSIAISNNISSGNNGELRFIGRPDAVNYNWAGIRAISDINGNQGVMAFFTSGYNTSAESSTERMRIDSSGRLLVGTSTATNNLRIEQALAVVKTGAGYGGMSLTSYNGTTSFQCPVFDFQRSRGTTDGSLTKVQTDDRLGVIAFRGADGSAFSDAALIDCYADGEWNTSGDTSDSPGRLVFSTTADGAATPTERMVIKADGKVGIGTSSPVTKLQVGTGNTGADTSIARFGTADANAYALTLTNWTGTTTSYGPKIAFDNSTRSTWVIGGEDGGGAFIFKDVTIGNNERMRLDSSGRLLVGTSTARDPAGEAKIESFNGPIAISTFANSAGFYGLNFIKSRGTSTNVVVQNNDSLSAIRFFGADGTGFIEGSRIESYVDGTPGANDMPGRLVFATTADGAATPTERMRIDNAGRIGVNGTNSTQQFAITHNGRDGLAISDTNGSSAQTNLLFSNTRAGGTANYYILGYSNVVTTFIVYSNGNVQNTNNSYGAISDLKLKENIVDANSQWNDIKALQVRNYNFKEGQTHTQIGLVAQEVELVSPGLVTETPDRDEEGNDLGTVTKSVNYSVLYMKAVKALQEAMERIETLEAKVATLEGV